MPPDLAAAFRALRMSPAFTVLAILTLGLGIGANTAMFSVVNSVLLRPLPGYDTGRLVNIVDPRGNGHLDPQAFRHIRERSQSLASVAGIQFCTSNLTGLAEPEQLIGPCTTANYFDLQRIAPMLGRTFLPEEDRPGRNRVVVLDYGFWQQRFGGDPKILEKTVTLNQEPWRVIGVMPPGFTPLGVVKPSIYIPFVMEDNPGTGIAGVGRLKPGVTLPAARAEMKLLSAELARLSPAEWTNVELRLEPVLESMTGAQRPLLLLLMGAVAFVLLIACVNVANLLLARANRRRREIALRVALGAGPGRIARLVLAEALLLALAASALAVTIALVGLRMLRPLTAGLPRSQELSVDGRVLLCTLILGVVSALLFGVLPALGSARTGAAHGTWAAFSGNVAGMQGRSTAPWQGALLGGEVALAFVLLAGAGLLIRSFVNIRAVNLGYDPGHVLTAFLALPPSGEQTTAGAEALYARIRERLAALSGVDAVATASASPPGGVMLSMDVEPEGEKPSVSARRANVDVVSEDYFRVTGIPLRRGRFFAATDRTGSAPVAVVSESIAQRYFGGNTAGRRIVVPQLTFNLDDQGERPAEIVGVVGNICVGSVSNCEPEHIYLPESQNALRLNYILVRTGGDPMQLAQAVRQAVAQESPLAPLDQPRTLESRMSNLTDAPKRGMWLLTLFAGLALVLAASGIFAVSLYLAGQRRQEIGIRKALGASRAGLVALLCRQCLAWAAGGLAVGLLAAAALSRLLTSLLFGVSPADPVALTAAGAGLLVIALAAAIGPAWRAAREDPASVIRADSVF